MYRLLLNEAIYQELVQTQIPRAKEFLWIATADIKDMHVESGRGFVPFLEVLDTLVDKGVAVRLIHAKEPGPRFRADFDNYDALVKSELFERVLCPRVHTKAVIVDGKLGFAGSPNLTGAGLGAKSPDRRNFEAGFLFDDRASLDALIDWIDRLYLGEYCHGCGRREYCPDPIIDHLPD